MTEKLLNPKNRLRSYKFFDGVFYFWVAIFFERNNQSVVFRVKESETPEKAAKEKKIAYRKLSPATKEEIDSWLICNPKDHGSFLVRNFCDGKQV